MIPVKFYHNLLWFLACVSLIIVVYFCHKSGRDIMTFWTIIATCVVFVGWLSRRFVDVEEREDAD